MTWAPAQVGGTYHTGNAVRLASEDAKQNLFKRAEETLGVVPEKMEIKDGMIYEKEQSG